MYCKYCMKTIEDALKKCPFCGKNQDTATPPHRLMPGTVLNNRYIVGVAKGEGGFGITYVGRDTKLDRLVAIKEYYPTGYVNRSNTTSPNVTEVVSEEQSAFFKKGCERFLDEAKILAKFSGEPGIVNVIDFFEENNTAYIIMEYLDGGSLKDYLKEYGKLTPDRTLEILRPVMLSLEKIHKHGLIHRDISPSNIMLVDENVKLIDFGAARNVSGGGNRSLSLMLKPGYAPEEQYRSKGVQGPWTDIYAICATIYKCVTGITPDEANDRLHSDELKTPSALGISVTPEFERTLMKGLAVFQKDRYQSIEELLDSFDGKESSSDSEEQTLLPLSSPSEDDNATQYVQSPLEDDKETQYEQRNLEDENETQYVSEEIPALHHKGVASTIAKDLNEIRTDNTIEKEAINRIRRTNKTKKIVSIAAVLAVCLITGIIIALFSSSRTENTSSDSVVSSALSTSNYTTSSTHNESSSYTRPDSDDDLISFYKQTITKSDIEKLKGKYVRTISMTECNVSQDAIDIIPEVSDNVHLLSFDGCTGFHDYSAIAKITNLSTLTIENCEITNDELKTIDFTKIHYLTSLHLNNDKNLTNIDVIKPLAESLLGLYIYSSPISDISVLADFSKLTSLFANDCNISDISSLASKPLERLRLANNSIKDISALSDVTTLYDELDLNDNEITTLEPIANNTKLIKLTVNRNKLHNLKGLERMLRLEKISATENEIDNLDGIINCTVLTEVNFNVNKLTDILVLKKSADKLQNVYVNDNSIEDLSCLSNASELQYLSFDNNRVKTIDALKNCFKLCGVSGENNKIKSIEFLKNLKTLQYIYFPHNEISDMSAISSLSQDILVLDLSSNNVSKLMLHASSKYTYLSIYNNPLESLEGIELVSGYYTIFSYIDNNYLDKLHDRFPYGITILDCPLDQQVNVEDTIGKYWVTFSSLQETEEFIHKTKQSVLTGKTDDN